MSTDKIKIPQVLVSYAGGSGGEWLAYQIAQHSRHHNEEIEIEINEYNRCRITGSWRQHLMNEGIPQREIWTEMEYTGDDLWWDEFWDMAPEKEEYYDMVRELVNREKPKWRIPVHRCHEAWYDVFWADLFSDFQIVSLYVDKNDEQSFRQFQSNIIKKIWWQDLTDHEDLADELKDKFRKFYQEHKGQKKGTYEDVVAIMDKFEGDVNYTDMMYALHVHHSGDAEAAIERVIDGLSQRWNRYNVEQHGKTIPGSHIILDFGDMFVRNKYSEYVRMCDFLRTDPWTESEWNTVIGPYTQHDLDSYITVEEMEQRLQNRRKQL
jgi:hypothetical protein